MASRLTLSDALWDRITPHLPAPPPHDPTVGGRPRVDDRSALDGILFVLYTGIGWQELPTVLGCGSGSTCWRRLHDWQEAGVWDTVLELLLADLVQRGRLDLANLIVDGSKVPAKKRGTGIGHTPTDRGRSGIKRHVLTDGEGLPLVLLTSPAHRQESLYLEILLPLIPTALRSVIDLQATPPIVHGDMGYDIPRCYKAIAEAGFIADIPERYKEKETALGKIRWHIERTFAWFNNFRRLIIRYERTEEMHMAFLKLACCVMCLRRLLAT